MKTKRGVAIIIVLLVMTLLAAVAWAVLSMSSGTLVQGKNDSEALQALYVAEGGAWSKCSQVAKAGELDDLTGTMPASGATFLAEVYESGETYEGVTVPANHYYIVCEAESRNGIVKKVAIMGYIGSSHYDFAAFGFTDVTMAAEAKTYAFSSSGGVIDHSRATVGSNNDTAGINISGVNTRVGGDSALARVYGPPGSIESSVVNGGSAPTNYVAFSPLTQRKPQDDFSFPLPDGTVDITASQVVLPDETFGDVALNGATLTLDVSSVPPGGTATFQFNSINVGTGSQIVISPPGADVYCEVFVKGAFTMTDGSIVNDSLIPAKLKFMIKGGDVNLLDTGTKAYYTAYAPENKITVESGNLYGSVIADQVEILDAGAIHYDVDLQNAGGASGYFRATSHRRF